MPERLRDLEDYSRKEIDLISYAFLRWTGWIIWITGLIFLMIGTIMFLGGLVKGSIIISLVGLSINEMLIPLGCLFLITGSLSILAGRRHFIG